MAYTLNHGADFFNIAGDQIATGEATWTVKVAGGAAQHVGSTTTLVDDIAPGVGSPNSMSILVTGTSMGVAKSVLAGTNIGELEAGYYIMQAGGAKTQHIHGDANFTALRSAANDGIKDSIHLRRSVRGTLLTTALRANKWNQITNSWDSGYPIADTSGLFSISANANKTDGSADHAALPSGTIPGELVYRDGSPTANQDDYPARYLW